MLSSVASHDHMENGSDAMLICTGVCCLPCVPWRTLGQRKDHPSIGMPHDLEMSLLLIELLIH